VSERTQKTSHFETVSNNPKVKHKKVWECRSHAFPSHYTRGHKSDEHIVQLYPQTSKHSSDWKTR